jgi:2-keto-4-pentenoate hydratase
MRRVLAVLLAVLAPLPAMAACPTLPEAARFAGAVIGRTAPPLPAAMSMPDALCARDRLVAFLAQPWGDQAGWKVARLAPGGAPVAAALLHGTLRERSGAALPAAFGIRPMVEPDLILVIRDEGVNEAGPDPLALLRHVEAAIPFLGLPDLVFGADAPWTPSLLAAVNGGVRLGVLGDPVPVPATPEAARMLAAATVTLSDGTRQLAGGPADPLRSLAWLVQELKEQGRRLRAGDHVAVGGFLAPLPATPGRYVATWAGLGPTGAGVEATLR